MTNFTMDNCEDNNNNNTTDGKSNSNNCIEVPPNQECEVLNCASDTIPCSSHQEKKDLRFSVNQNCDVVTRCEKITMTKTIQFLNCRLRDFDRSKFSKCEHCSTKLIDYCVPSLEMSFSMSLINQSEFVVDRRIMYYCTTCVPDKLDLKKILPWNVFFSVIEKTKMRKDAVFTNSVDTIRRHMNRCLCCSKTTDPTDSMLSAMDANQSPYDFKNDNLKDILNLNKTKWIDSINLIMLIESPIWIIVNNPSLSIVQKNFIENLSEFLYRTFRKSLPKKPFNSLNNEKKTQMYTPRHPNSIRSHSHGQNISGNGSTMEFSQTIGESQQLNGVFQNNERQDFGEQTLTSMEMDNNSNNDLERSTENNYLDHSNNNDMEEDENTIIQTRQVIDSDSVSPTRGMRSFSDSSPSLIQPSNLFESTTMTNENQRAEDDRTSGSQSNPRNPRCALRADPGSEASLGTVLESNPRTFESPSVQRTFSDLRRRRRQSSIRRTFRHRSAPLERQGRFDLQNIIRERSTSPTIFGNQDWNSVPNANNIFISEHSSSQDSEINSGSQSNIGDSLLGESFDREPNLNFDEYDEITICVDGNRVFYNKNMNRIVHDCVSFCSEICKSLFMENMEQIRSAFIRGQTNEDKCYDERRIVTFHEDKWIEVKHIEGTSINLKNNFLTKHLESWERELDISESISLVSI